MFTKFLLSKSLFFAKLFEKYSALYLIHEFTTSSITG